LNIEYYLYRSLLDRYGVTELQVAVQEALQCGFPHFNAARLALERRREAREETPPVEIPLATQSCANRNTIIQPHDLDISLRIDFQTKAISMG